MALTECEVELMKREHYRRWIFDFWDVSNLRGFFRLRREKSRRFTDIGGWREDGRFVSPWRLIYRENPVTGGGIPCLAAKKWQVAAGGRSSRTDRVLHFLERNELAWRFFSIWNRNWRNGAQRKASGALGKLPPLVEMGNFDQSLE